MKRRSVLLTTVGLGTAGCSSLPENNADQSSDQDTNVSNMDNSLTEEDHEVVTDTQIELSIDQNEWSDDGSSVEYVISNLDQEHAARINLVTQWFDNDGYYIGSSQNDLSILDAKRSWYVEVPRPESENVVEFSSYLSGSVFRYDKPDAIEILSIDTDTRTIEGLANNTSDSIMQMTVSAASYDGNWITHIGSATDRYIPANTEWKFVISMSTVSSENDQMTEGIELYVQTSS